MVLQNNLPDLFQQIKFSTIMTVRKAIKGLDIFIANREGMKKQLIEFSRDLKSDSGHQMAREIDGFLDNEIEFLNAIKRQLLPEQHRTKIVCKHPKKDHDTSPDGQKYCMNCNANL